MHNLCGERYPDFYFAILAPMIRSIENVKEQDALWKKALSLFGRRHDLAAGVLDQRARMWQAAGEPARAGRQYELIIERYANAGPFVLRALSSAERILVEGRQPRKVLELYDQAYRRIDRPKQSAGPFFRQSNFFKVGRRYAERLDGAGLGRQAAMIRREIGDG